MYNDIEKLITDNINFYNNRTERVNDVIEGFMTIEEILKIVIKKTWFGDDFMQNYWQTIYTYDILCTIYF